MYQPAVFYTSQYSPSIEFSVLYRFKHDTRHMCYQSVRSNYIFTFIGLAVGTLHLSVSADVAADSGYSVDVGRPQVHR